MVVADRGYDSEENHVFVRERHNAYSIIPPRYQDVPVWKTHGRYKIQEAAEMRLSKTALQSAEQGRNYHVCHKAAVWRIPDIKAGQDTEERTDIQVHRLQYTSGDQSSCVVGDGFYKADPFLES